MEVLLETHSYYLFVKLIGKKLDQDKPRLRVQLSTVAVLPSGKD